MNDQIVHYMRADGSDTVCGAFLSSHRVHISDDPRDTTCGNCMRTEAWKRAAKPEKRIVFFGGVAHVVDTYTSHFATCPDAGKYRKRD